MYKLKLRRCLVFTPLLMLLSTSIAANEIHQLDWTGAREEWGRLLFCQHIYKLPEVSPRLYSFDIEHCDKAGQLMAVAVSKYSKQEQVDLKNQAQQHAALLFRNTSEPYHSVVACRAFCQELAEKQDTRNDR
jgi:hypothetical protein